MKCGCMKEYVKYCKGNDSRFPQQFSNFTQPVTIIQVLLNTIKNSRYFLDFSHFLYCVLTMYIIIQYTSKD